jgi:hypothetical protein
MEELDHQPGESLKGTGNANAGVDLDEDALGGMDVDLEFTGLVDGGVEEGEETLRQGQYNRIPMGD